MAVYIPRNRLGDRGPRQEERRLTQRIEGMPQYQAIRSSLAGAKAEAEAGLKEKYESNAEVQRWRTLTKEEKMRDAIDRMIPTAQKVQELKTGKECSADDARRYVEGLAYKSDKDKK